MAALAIVRPGMFTTVQDLGRWGYQSSGVPVSGALDWFAHRLANRLLGNDPGSATLEVTMTGPQVRFEEESVFVVTGAEFQLTLDAAPVPMHEAVQARAGSVLGFGERHRGARACIGVGGGIDVPEVLGSRSTHVLTGMGGYQGRALRAGDVLPTGPENGSGIRFSQTSRRTDPGTVSLPDRRLRVIAVDAQLTAQITARQARISPQSNRMGYRLEGANVPGAPAGELISTSVPVGAIQVPPGGEPILLLNDHATTGGYAIAAVVITADLPLAAQLAPGDPIEFEVCSLDAADQALREREAVLAGA
jgi:antagonist of KipI